MLFNREAVVSALEKASVGVASRESIEQATCFVFKDRRVFAFNDNTAASAPVPVDWSGAVPAVPLLQILRKLQEEELDGTVTEAELVISGKRKKIGLRFETEIVLPMDTVPDDLNWTDLPDADGFGEAVLMASECTGKNEEKFLTVCLHITPDYVEACDNFQLCRYAVPTGIAGDILVRRDSIRQVPAIGIDAVCLTDSWLHFRGPGDILVSCRRYVADYHNLDSVLDVRGAEIEIPAALTEEVETATIFTNERPDDNLLRVELKSGKMRIYGEGVSGWYQSIRAVAYSGPPITFKVQPGLLAKLAKNYTKCVVNEKAIRVQSARFDYVAALTVE